MQAAPCSRRTRLSSSIVLPVVSGATLFPEDRGPAQYTINFDPKTVN